MIIGYIGYLIHVLTGAGIQDIVLMLMFLRLNNNKLS